MVRPYPASALDLFSVVIKFPTAMVMALIKSGEDDFESVWSLSTQLPFSWYLLPITAWISAAGHYFGSLRATLSEVSNGEEIVWGEFQKFKGRVSSQRPFFKQICDWISHTIFPERTLQNSELFLSRDYPKMIINFIRDEELKFQSRHDTKETYPQGPQIMRRTDEINFPREYQYRQLAKPFRPVRCAPFVAANISLQEQGYNEELLFELKVCRDFDREWFNIAYAYALCLGLNQLIKK
jgi:hypothetical protein